MITKQYKKIRNENEGRKKGRIVPSLSGLTSPCDTDNSTSGYTHLGSNPNSNSLSHKHQI